MTDAAPPATSTAFARATAVAPQGEGRYRADVVADWSAPTGPNGGYLAAILVRALEGELAPAGERRLRSLTVHYLRTAALGPLAIGGLHDVSGNWQIPMIGVAAAVVVLGVSGVLSSRRVP